MRIRKNKKKIFLIILCIALVLPVAVTPLATVIIYESIFQFRFETPSWLAYSVEEFDGLQVQRSDFYGENGEKMAGYRYAKGDQPSKGVMILAHGYGGGGHIGYLPIIDYFASNGYAVFAYDARGNDNSEGDHVEGLPQGVMDLDSAINHVQSLAVYENLPVVLLGHSWGAYSVGSVLSLHPEVKGAVLMAGFNESENMLSYQSSQILGSVAEILIPPAYVYEDIKFGTAYTDLTAIDGMAATDARIMIIHSADDTTVPVAYGYDLFYREFGNSDRFTFILFQDRGHGYLFCSDEARARQQQVEQMYETYLQENDLRDTNQTKAEFMGRHMDKKQCFALDLLLMDQILEMYDAVCTT